MKNITIKSDEMVSSILTRKCPLCGKDYKEGQIVWNDRNGILKGVTICLKCYEGIFGQGEKNNDN